MHVQASRPSNLTATSETVASTLVYLFYFLALYPNHLELLQAELSNVDIRNYKALQSLEHLNGVINESLRLWPAVPTGGLRQAPPGGVDISDHFVPGGTTICAPRWSLARRKQTTLDLPCILVGRLVIWF
jgi:cytochrome P450